MSNQLKHQVTNEEESLVAAKKDKKDRRQLADAKSKDWQSELQIRQSLHRQLISAVNCDIWTPSDHVHIQ